MYLPIVLRTHRICYIHFYTHNFLIDFLSEAVIKYTAYNIIFFSWYMKKKIWHYFLIILFLTQTLMTQITISWYKNLYDDISLMVEHHITLLRSNYTLRPHRWWIYAQSILYIYVRSFIEYGLGVKPIRDWVDSFNLLLTWNSVGSTCVNMYTNETHYSRPQKKY